MKCDKCGNEKITYYRQIIKGGRVYVTARCGNGHSPKKGQPFYSMANFDVDKLPLLPKDEDFQEQQEELFLSKPITTLKPTPPPQKFPYKNFPIPVSEK